MYKPPRIVIAAIASRPYVEMAKKAGYEVIAIDAFADEDLKRLVDEVHQLPVENGVFSTTALAQLLSGLDWRDVVGVCYGAGFEAQPDNIRMLAQYCPVIGNSADTIAMCKDIQQFTRFCEQYHFAFPTVLNKRPDNIATWLVKTENSSGGTHVHYANQASTLAPNQYYQQFQEGTPVSCVFLANGYDVSLVGVNEQWCNASDELPFRYGGAVSHFSVSAHVYEQMQRFAQAATKHFNLYGLNSVDAILHDERLYFLEINPRLSATVSFYDTNDFHLFQHHVNAVQKGVLPEKNNTTMAKTTIKAHQIKYAQHDCSIVEGNQWPTWVSDRPKPKQSIVRNMPILTINAAAECVCQAKQLVETRAASIF